MEYFDDLWCFSLLHTYIWLIAMSWFCWHTISHCVHFIFRMISTQLMEAVDTSHLDYYTVSYLFSLSLVFLTQSNLYTASQRIILKHPPTVKYLPFFNVFLGIRNSGKSLPCHSTLNFPTVSSGQEQWWTGKRTRQDKSSPRGSDPCHYHSP